MRDIINKVASRLAERTGTLPSVTIHSSAKLSDDTHLVVISHSSDAGNKANLEALNRVLKGRATPVEGSFRRVNPSNEYRLVSVGYVVANTATEELTKERKDHMTVVAKNILMDQHDQSLWNVIQSDTGSTFIRRQDNEDVSELLATMASSRFDVPDVDTVNAYTSNAGDYVAYVDSANARLSYGFVVSASEDTSTIIPRGSEDSLQVSNELVVAKVTDVDSNDFLTKRLSVEANLKDPDKVKEYYRQLYSYDPKYLELVEQTIDQQASL